MRFTPFQHSPYFLAVLIPLLCASVSRAAIIIIQDDFTGTAGNLNNRVASTPQTTGDNWWIGSTVQQTGTEMELSTNGTFGKAALDFDDSLLAANTETITFSVDWRIDHESWTDEGSTLYFGFGGSAGDGGGIQGVALDSFNDNNLGMGFRLRGNFSGTSVVVKAGAGDANPSSFTDRGNLTRLNDNSDWSNTFSMVYTLDIDQVEFFIDGGSIGTSTYVGDIGGIWFKADGLLNGLHPGFLFDDLEVSATVPEPSACAQIVALLGLLYAIARRHQ